MTEIIVVDADITTIAADAVIVTIDPDHVRRGSINEALRGRSGEMFHAQAEAAKPLRDGQVVYTHWQCMHHGMFNAVLFVVDELRRPLGELVTRALEEAVRLKLTSISIPALRTGMAAYVYETRDQALSGLVDAITGFVENHTEVFDKVTIVVHGNKADRMMLEHLCDAN